VDDHNHFQIVFKGAPMPLQVCKLGIIDMLQFYRIHLVLKPMFLMDVEYKKQKFCWQYFSQQWLGNK
jgi:hypothetical protein